MDKLDLRNSLREKEKNVIMIKNIHKSHGMRVYLIIIIIDYSSLMVIGMISACIERRSSSSWS